MEGTDGLIAICIALLLGAVAFLFFREHERGQGSSSSMRPQRSTRSMGSFQAIPDQFKTIPEVQSALRKAGLESSNLIIGIDFTKSNEFTGARTFEGQNLHTLSGTELNPYQQSIQIIGNTLEVFDDDKLIPAYGFGDITTKDKKVFPFFPDRVCYTVNEVLARYTEIASNIIMSGPTSFAPIIREAIDIVKEEKAYHILLIIADGQVTNERETVEAIVEAANYPLSIVLIGVGDGPWEMMEEFDDGLPQRAFDNFQFVNFHEIMSKYPVGQQETAFAISALQEIPDQFKAVRKLHLL